MSYPGVKQGCIMQWWFCKVAVLCVWSAHLCRYKSKIFRRNKSPKQSEKTAFQSACGEELSGEGVWGRQRAVSSVDNESSVWDSDVGVDGVAPVNFQAFCFLCFSPLIETLKCPFKAHLHAQMLNWWLIGSNCKSWTFLNNQTFQGRKPLCPLTCSN